MTSFRWKMMAGFMVLGLGSLVVTAQEKNDAATAPPTPKCECKDCECKPEDKNCGCCKDKPKLAADFKCPATPCPAQAPAVVAVPPVMPAGSVVPPAPPVVVPTAAAQVADNGPELPVPPRPLPPKIEEAPVVTAPMLPPSAPVMPASNIVIETVPAASVPSPVPPAPPAPPMAKEPVVPGQYKNAPPMLTPAPVPPMPAIYQAPQPPVAPPAPKAPVLKPIASGSKADPNNLKLYLRMGPNYHPRFEIKSGDEVLLKVSCEKIDMTSAADGATNLAGLTASGKVKFSGPALDGHCDSLTILSASGEVLLKGSVYMRCRKGKSCTDLSAERVVFQLGSEKMISMPESSSSVLPTGYRED